MNFDEMKEKATDFAQEHSDKVKDAADKAGDAAKERFGHDDQVDSATEKVEGFLGDDKDDKGKN
jgi:hypothetical protein